MRFTASAVGVVTGILATSLVSQSFAFSPNPSFVGHNARVSSVPQQKQHTPGCDCAACLGLHAPPCPCSSCASRGSSKCTCASYLRSAGNTRLFADVTEEAEATVEASEDVPAEVEAMDGVETSDEAHNLDRPARESLKKKRTQRGKPLSDFNEGDMVKATVKSIASYGAFCDFGAKTDGLLHISRMAKGFVKDVSEIVQAGQEVEVRLVSIDSAKGQVALSLLTQEEEEAAAAESSEASSRPKRQQQRQGAARSDDSAVLGALKEQGFDSDTFVAGKVVSTVTFGAFVRVDASLLNPDVEGEFDGLVHISALTAGRANSVEEYAKEGQEVQVRVKSIGDGKVALSMVSAEDEAAAREFSNDSSAEVAGAKDWAESLEKIKAEMPVFENRPRIVYK